MIINATNIGKRLSGIGRYSLSLSRYLLQHWEGRFRLMVNAEGLAHLSDFHGDPRLWVVPGYLSPDHGFRGHLLRLLWSNGLAFSRPNEIVFNTSQLEGSPLHKRQVIAVHDCIPYLFPEHHKKQYPYFRFYLPLVLKRAARIITGSEFTRERIVEIYRVPADKISVIHYGIDPAGADRPVDSERDNYILYVGRPSPTKNLEGLIEAFSILTARHPSDLRLKVTCSRADVRFPLTRDLEGRVDFLGYVPEDALIPLYRRALLFTWPSLHEGFGFPPLEAMRCGCPAVVSNASCLPEIYQDAALYFDPHNAGEMADAMQRVITDAGLRKQLISNGYKRVSELTWEASAKKHIQVFESLMAGD